MKRPVFIAFVLLFTAICARPASGQDYQKMREELIAKQENTRAEIEELTRQINSYEERLMLAEEKFDRLYRQYEDLQRLIALQNEKLNRLQEEQRHINDEIRITDNEIGENQQKLEQLIESYKSSLRYVYKHGRTSQLALIFTAGSINQMMVRSHYLNKFEEHRQKQARQIRETQAELERNRRQLEEAGEKNDEILAEIREEKAELDKQKEQQEKNVELLRRDRNQIEERLKQTRREKELLDETLTRLILEEERAREMARSSASARRDGYLDDAELNEIESSFASMKGKLPWPVESRTITEKFGPKRHPVYGTVTQNLGIEIVTKPKESVRVVQDGYVFDIRPLAGFGDVVFVSHGKYKTAYGNLSEVLVRKNARLKAGDIIGLAGEEHSPLGETLFFLIREGSQNVTPEIWLDKSGSGPITFSR